MKITLDGETYHVQVSESREGELEVNVNGTVHRVEIQDLELDRRGANAFKPEEAKGDEVAQPVTVMAAGNSITAPMPGDVVEVLVKPGDRVKVGQALCVLEAMKMKNLIRSPIERTVARVDVSPGQSVEYGAVLVTFQQTP